MMKKLIIPFFGLCVAMLAACNEDSASTTVAPVETIIDTTYVEVVETIFDTVVRDSADTVVIRKYNDIVKRDTIQLESECTSDENDSTITIICGNEKVVINKATCGNTAYDPSKSFCHEDQVLDFCDGYAYNPEKYFCFEDSLIALCDGKAYNPNTHYCQNNKKTIEFGYFVDERDNQKYKYVVIGNQTWMAENLNYAYNLPTRNLDSSSMCFNNNPENCEKYGRLYLWSAAMDSAALFGGTGMYCGVGERCFASEKVRGVCPKGWHLPDTTEWFTLITPYADSIKESSLYRYFYGAADDFVHPSGFSIDFGGFCETRRNPIQCARPIYVDFWSSTSYFYSEAYFLVFMVDENKPYLEHHYKYVERPVRCIKDEPF